MQAEPAAPDYAGRMLPICDRHSLRWEYLGQLLVRIEQLRKAKGQRAALRDARQECRYIWGLCQREI